jgi:hypothetical protein
MFAANVLHDVDGARDLALAAKGHSGIQDGFPSPVQALDLDNLAQRALALIDGTCDGPLVALNQPPGIRPPAAMVLVVSQTRLSDTPNLPSFLIQLLNRSEPVDDNNADRQCFDNEVTAIFREDPHILKGYEVGAIDYIGKPFNPDILKAKVGVYTNLYLKSRQNAYLQEAERLLREEGNAKVRPNYIGVFPTWRAHVLGIATDTAAGPRRAPLQMNSLN